MFRESCDTALGWYFRNPKLEQGERGHELDTKYEKIGDGIHFWRDLPYESCNFYHGHFYSNQTQAAAANAQEPCKFDGNLSSNLNRGIELTNNHTILVRNTGIYLFNLNLHVENTATAAPPGVIHVWMAKNSDDPSNNRGYINGTTTRADVPVAVTATIGKQETTVNGLTNMMVNHTLSLKGGDLIQFYWTPSTDNLKLQNALGDGTPVERPHRHSLLLNVTQIQANYIHTD